jgi:hypothetical protein
MIPVKGHTGLVRDIKSGAIINMAGGGEEYSANRAKIKADTERLDKVEQDVSEIKMMLQTLIER